MCEDEVAMARDSLRQDDRYRAGLAAPQPDAGPEPVAWPLQDQFVRFARFVDLWINRPGVSDAERVSVIRYRPRSKEFESAVGTPAYAAPPAPVPAGEVTEAMFEAAQREFNSASGWNRTQPEKMRSALRAALAAKETKRC